MTHDPFCDLHHPCADTDDNETPHTYPENHKDTKCLQCDHTCSCGLITRIRADEQTRISTSIKRLDAWHDQSAPLNPDADVMFQKFQMWVDIDEALAIVADDKDKLARLREERAGE